MTRLLLGSIALIVLIALTAPALADERTDAISAIAKRDIEGVKAHVRLPLIVKNVRFAGPTCEPFWGERVEVGEDRLATLVGCLADAGIKPLTGKEDVWATAVYGPGAPLIVPQTADRKIAMLYSSAKPGSTLFDIEPVTFTSHIEKFKREVVPSPELKAAIDAQAEPALANIVVCVDQHGKTGAVARESGEPNDYTKHVIAVVKTWKIAPFKFAGKPVNACATLILGYPASRITVPLQIPRPLPPPPPGSQPDVPSRVLEELRIAGKRAIVPDDATKTLITASKKAKVIGSFKLCIDVNGAVTNVTLLKSTGFAAYDQKLATEMKSWAYKPYRDSNQVAKPVCTAVTFIYAQQ